MIYAVIAFIIIFGVFALAVYSLVHKKRQFLLNMAKQVIAADTREEVEDIAEDCAETIAFLEFFQQEDSISTFERVVEMRLFSFNKPTFTDEFFEEEAS